MLMNHKAIIALEPDTPFDSHHLTTPDPSNREKREQKPQTWRNYSTLQTPIHRKHTHIIIMWVIRWRNEIPKEAGLVQCHYSRPIRVIGFVATVALLFDFHGFEYVLWLCGCRRESLSPVRYGYRWFDCQSAFVVVKDTRISFCAFVVSCRML